MSRPNRIFFAGAVYHVYNRLARGERVFDDEFEARRFKELLAEISMRDGLTVFAWALLGNHWHIALRVSEVPLERPIRSLQQRITRGVNARRRVFGPLWQGRYKAKLVNEQRYLDQLLVYIHLNPVKAGIVADPADYSWSGHREILGLEKEPIVDVDAVLRLFGKTRRKARAAYGRIIEVAAGEEWTSKLPGHLPWWRLGRPVKGGDEDPEIAYRLKQEEKMKGPADRPLLDAEVFVKLGAIALEVSVDALRSRHRSAEIVSAREHLAILGVERYGLRVVDLAAVMNKSPDTLTKAIARVAGRRASGAENTKSIDDLDATIAAAGFACNNGGMA